MNKSEFIGAVADQAKGNASDLLNAKWSQEIPEKSGHYWLLRPQADGALRDPIMCYVALPEGRILVADQLLDHLSSVAIQGSLWSGPLLPPRQPAEL